MSVVADTNYSLSMASSSAGSQHHPDDNGDGPSTRKRKEGNTGKRRKVSHACLYCRRSHMTCDDSRPCQRCIKRDIGHLCHDEPKTKPHETSTIPEDAPQTGSSMIVDSPTNMNNPGPVPTVPVTTQSPFNFPLTGTNGASTWPLLFPPETGSTEFSVLSDFLESLEDQTFFNGGPPGTNGLNGYPANAGPNVASTVAPPMLSGDSNNSFASYGSGPSSMPPPLSPFGSTGGGFGQPPMLQQPPQLQQPQPPNLAPQQALPAQLQSQPPQPQLSSQQPSQPHQQHPTSNALSRAPSEHIDVLPPGSTTKTERFLLTAADQEDGTRDERLARVIHAKYEAGLLKPFNYVKGYARLLRWMDRNVSPQSKQAILQPLSIVRPKFRAIAQSLTDIDLVFIEEAFERLLLNYDRVFSAMGIPACLWRRTGEIYKGNKEFADLVGVDVSQLRDGHLCIYELMSEESAVNYWEKYGHVAFDAAQKAVLTSCVLRYKPSPSSLSGTSSGAATSPTTNMRKSRKDGPLQERFINCCFSFTIQRDLHGIPTLIAGNFIRH